MNEDQLKKYWKAYTDAWRLIKNRDRVQKTHVAEMVKRHDIGIINRLFCLVVWQEIERINKDGIPLEDSKYQAAFIAAWRIFKKYSAPDDTDEFWMGLIEELNMLRLEYHNSQFIRNLLIQVTLEEIERIERNEYHE